MARRSDGIKRRVRFTSQRKYLEKVLDRLNMDNYKPMSIPRAAYFKLSFESFPRFGEDIEKMSNVRIICSFMYAMMRTGPNLFYVVSLVS